MASGDTLETFTPIENRPPTSNAAYPDSRNGHDILVFNKDTDWSAIFKGFLPRNYAGGGITVRLQTAYDTITSGTAVWTAEIERIQAGTLDIDSDSFAAAQTANATVPGTAGIPVNTDITFTDGAQMDSLAAGEWFRLRVTRDANNGSDNADNNGQLLGVEIRET